MKFCCRFTFLCTKIMSFAILAHMSAKGYTKLSKKFVIFTL